MTSTSAALERIILPWVAKIAEVFGVIVAIIVANAKEVRTIHATARAFVVDISGKSEALIKAQLAEPWAREPSRRLMIAMTPPAHISHTRYGLRRTLSASSTGPSSLACSDWPNARGAKRLDDTKLERLLMADAGERSWVAKGPKVYG